MKDFAIIGLTIVFTWFIIKVWNKTKGIKVPKLIYRQSTIYSMVKPIIPKELFQRSVVMRQSQKHKDKTSFKVMFFKDKAYWVLNNTFYIADANNGNVIEESIKAVDTMDMSQEEIDFMLSILDNLNNGGNFNDNSGSGNQ